MSNNLVLTVACHGYDRVLALKDGIVHAEGIDLRLVDLKDVAGKSKNMMERLKGRVIGKAGKSREEIERLTETYISVYGKTIGIIGEITQVSIARQAVAMLLQGSMHKTVYSFLEKKKKEILFGR